MELLKSKQDWVKWATKNFFESDKVMEPKEFPCFAALKISAWQCERDVPIYLRKADIKSLLDEITEEEK